MRSTTQRLGTSDTIVLWLACLFALAAGASIGFFRLEAAIDAQHQMTAHALAVARANELLVRERGDLLAREQRLDVTIRHLDLDADHPTAVARFVREAANLAAVHHTSVVRIDEGRAEPLDPHDSAGSAQDERLESIPFDVSLSGSYRDLLATVQDLGRSAIALHIEVAAIEQTRAANDAPSAAPLTARLHIGVERLRDGTSTARPANTFLQESHDARYR